VAAIHIACCVRAGCFVGAIMRVISISSRVMRLTRASHTINNPSTGVVARAMGTGASGFRSPISPQASAQMTREEPGQVIGGKSPRRRFRGGRSAPGVPAPFDLKPPRRTRS
jgi:hypothetical protein